MEVAGKIKKIFEEQTFSSGFRKREVVVTTQEQYPQHISIEFLQDKIDLVSSLNEGDEVKVSINLRGREWTNPEGVTKYFNSITGWKVEKISQETAANDYKDLPPVPPMEKAPDLSANGEDYDDLPF